MPPSAPTVSIGLPVYNGAAYVAQAVESLLAQTWTDFELILCDNASDDGTWDLLRRYAADPRVRLERHPRNLGAAANFNHVVRLAQGRFFRWHAHDDVCEPSHLERCVQVLERDPTVVWTHCRYGRIDAQGRRLPDPQDRDVDQDSSAPSRESPRPHQRLAAILLGRVGNGGIFGLIRRQVLLQTGLELGCYGSDKVLVAELALRGRYHHIRETLFWSRHHPQGSGALTTQAQLQQFINPNGRPCATRLRLLGGHLVAVWNAPLDRVEKLRCAGVLARYMGQWRKWPRLWQANGGGYRATLAAANRSG